MPRATGSFVVPGVLIVVASLLAFAWGLSWAMGGFPECGSGSYFLADVGWAFVGFLLGLAVGIVVPVVVAARGSFVLAVAVVIVTGIVMLLAGDAGASMAPGMVGCTEWDTRGAESMLVLGLAISSVPILLITGIVAGIRALGRRREPGQEDGTGAG